MGILYPDSMVESEGNESMDRFRMPPTLNVKDKEETEFMLENRER